MKTIKINVGLDLTTYTCGPIETVNRSLDIITEFINGNEDIISVFVNDLNVIKLYKNYCNNIPNINVEYYLFNEESNFVSIEAEFEKAENLINNLCRNEVEKSILTLFEEFKDVLDQPYVIHCEILNKSNECKTEIILLDPEDVILAHYKYWHVVNSLEELLNLTRDSYLLWKIINITKIENYYEFEE